MAKVLMRIKSSTSNTITEYTTVTTGEWSLDFKKTKTGDRTLLTCYPKKNGVVKGFISYDTDSNKLTFQLNDQQSSELSSLSELFDTVTDCIQQITN